MDNKELERIQNELLAEELSLDELLADEELNELLAEPAYEPGPAFDDPDRIHEPKEPLIYRNYATQEQQAAATIRKKNDHTVIGLLITACCLCLGIIGLLGYWLTVLL